MNNSRALKPVMRLSVLVLYAASIFFCFRPVEAAIKKKLPASAPRAEAARSAPLPKKGSIAVLVKGPSEQHTASALAIMVQHLTARGYKVVDQNKLAQIRKSKAAQYALEGNVDAIMKLSSQYGIGTTITVNVTAGQPVENEFQLQTGTASAAVKAVSSGGALLYGDTVSGKQVGYTPDEASQKALEAAVMLAVERMTR
ncbi:MAG: CsgG/HfaB family protein [Synergistaceae bacterium]|nr:CsgG/HfaB family protein [Synergistaceae bacterium]